MSDAVVIGYLDLDQRQSLCSLKPLIHRKPLCTVSQSEKPNGVTSFEVFLKFFCPGEMQSRDVILENLSSVTIY